MGKMCIPCGGFKKLSINDDIVPDSAFIFACRRNVFGILIGLGTWVLEFTVLLYFYQISQEDHPKSVYVHMVPTCDTSRRRMVGDFATDVAQRRAEIEEGGNAICSGDGEISQQAVVTGLILLILSIAPDLIGGFHLAVRRRSVMQTITGCAMMVLSIMALVAASAFVVATAKEDTDVYTNCIAILFVFACDEQVFHIIKMLFPDFVEETIMELTEGDDSTAIGLINDVRYAELMGRKNITVETEMTSGSQQVESPHAGAV